MIGVFDSGMGGLTVVGQIWKAFPEQKIIYFGDTARLPYGTKGVDFVKRYSEKIIGWLLERGAEDIVIACHTSSALAGNHLRKRFKDIRISDMISLPAPKIAGSFSRIGIIGTPGTIKSKSWEKMLLQENPKIKIYSKACPLFVPLVEEGWINGRAAEEIAESYLKSFKNIDALVLACTHYPILKRLIKKRVGKNIKIVDPAEILANELKFKVKDKGESRFYFSDTPYNLKKISQLCLKKEIKPIITNPF